MKNFQLVLVMLALALSPVQAKKDHNKKDHKAKQARGIGSEGHPVFGGGRQHPVHDDKVIGKFKNADKIKAKVQELDELDDTELKDELGSIQEEQGQLSQRIKELRANKLAEIAAKKAELEAAQAELEQSGLDADMMTKLTNGFQSFLNDAKLKDVTKEESAAKSELSKLNEDLQVKQLLGSYINSKLAQ